MPRPAPLSPAALVAHRFGDYQTLARKLGVDRTTALRWVQSGHIPRKRIPSILALARRERIALTEAEALMGRAG